MVMAEHDERTFLCGYQRARGYGSTSRPQSSSAHYSTVIRHEVKPTDTLQGLALRYNTSMTEMKRLNRLWSNESLYLKTHVSIPIYESKERTSEESSRPESPSRGASEQCAETFQDIFKRIDSNIKKSSHNVRRLEKNASSDWSEREHNVASTRHNTRAHHRHSLNSMSNYQTSL